MKTTNTINRRAKLIDWLEPLAPEVCTKVQHLTQASALAHVKHLLETEHTHTIAYKCPVCKTYHVGHHSDRAK